MIQIEIDERHSSVVALQKARDTLQDLITRRLHSEKELESVIEKRNARRLDRDVDLDSAIGQILGSADPTPKAPTADDIGQLQHEIEVINAAIKRQEKVVDGARSEFSKYVCEANYSAYVAIERRILKAVAELAEANRVEKDFFAELIDNGVAPTHEYRVMRVDVIGFANDPNSLASLHRRELQTYVPEALK